MLRCARRRNAEADATRIAQKYLSYFQGRTTDWEAPDQRALRHVVPESRTRMYDMRELIATLCDKDSVLEIRPNFGVGIITCLVRIEVSGQTRADACSQREACAHLCC